MKYRVIPLLLGLLAISLVLAQAINPGIRLRVTDKALQYGKSPHTWFTKQYVTFIDDH